jgi:hypothetical protein
MSIRKLLLFFFACALMVPVSNAAQAARSALISVYTKRLARLAVDHRIPMAPAPISIMRAGGFDVSSPDGKCTNGAGSSADDAPPGRNGLKGKRS